MAKLLRIDLSSLKATTEDVPDAYQRFGGRGLTACILDREVPPTCDPLGSENKLIWAPGLMGGHRLHAVDGYRLAPRAL